MHDDLRWRLGCPIGRRLADRNLGQQVVPKLIGSFLSDRLRMTGEPQRALDLGRGHLPIGDLAGFGERSSGLWIAKVIEGLE